MWITTSLDTAKRPTAIALGNFDGVHLGHRQVIQPVLRDRAPAFTAPASPPKTLPDQIDQRFFETTSPSSVGGYSTWAPDAQPTPSANPANVMPQGNVLANAKALPCYTTVLTFNPHPQEYFSGQPRRLLTPLNEKATQLKLMGVDQIVLLPFNQTLANLSPEAFVEDILIGRLQAQHISVGADFRFGYRRAGTADLLNAIAADHGIPVTIVPLKLIHDDIRISSSSIREALLQGNLDRVRQRLGRSYSLTGRVVMGQQLGRTLGFPTANLKLPEEKFIPCQGVYGVWVHGISGDGDREVPQPGVMNIGVRPTVSGHEQTVEVHVLNWSGDLYDKMLTVELIAFLRAEQKFDSLDQLKAQIQADCETALQLFPVGDRA